MNSFPVIFARGRDLSQLAKIRESFVRRDSPTEQLVPQATKIILKPKDIKLKLKRPYTARNAKTAKPHAEKSQPAIATATADETASSKFVRKVHAPLAPSLKPTNFVMFQELRRKSTSPEKSLQPDRTAEKLPEERSKSALSNKPQHRFTRSKSAEFFETAIPSGRISKESEMWTVSNTDAADFSPNQRIPREDMSPFATDSPVRRAQSPLSLREGEASLPSQFAYSHYFMKLFGSPVKRSEIRLALLAYLSTLGVRISSSAHVRVTHNSESEEVYVIVTGPSAPLTQCCAATVIFSFSRENTGKALCTASYCQSRTVANFHVPLELREKLWSTATTRTSMSSKELSTHVRKGSYKTVSLRREMDKRCQTAERKTEKLLLTNSKPIFSNEKLKFVTPASLRPTVAMRLPTDLQIDTLTPAGFSSLVNCNPLYQVLERTNSRHNTVRKRYTTDQILEHLSHLLHE